MTQEFRDALGYWVECCVLFVAMLARMGHAMGRSVAGAFYAWLDFMTIRPARTCLVQYVVPVPPRPMPVPRRWVEPVPAPEPEPSPEVAREVPVPVPVPAEVPGEICGNVAETPEQVPSKKARKKPSKRREKVAVQAVQVLAPAHLPDPLTGLTVAQLKTLCKAEGRRGYSSLKKGELIALLRTPVPAQ